MNGWIVTLGQSVWFLFWFVLVAMVNQYWDRDWSVFEIRRTSGSIWYRLLFAVVTSLVGLFMAFVLGHHFGIINISNF